MLLTEDIDCPGRPSEPTPLRTYRLQDVQSRALGSIITGMEHGASFSSADGTKLSKLLGCGMPCGHCEQSMGANSPKERDSPRGIVVRVVLKVVHWARYDKFIINDPGQIRT